LTTPFPLIVDDVDHVTPEQLPCTAGCTVARVGELPLFRRFQLDQQRVWDGQHSV